MKQASLRRLALNIGLLSGGFTFFTLLGLTYLYDIPNAWMISFAAGTGAFALISFFFLYVVRKFIDSRIRTLYKTIYNVKLDDGEQFNAPEGDDIIAQMQREVTNWMKNRSTEIEDLKKLEHYRREFLGNVSHELKTPTFNIQGYITTLLEGGLEDPSINRNYLERAEKSVDRMINIIDDLESISRLESGEMILDKEPFDIVELTNELVDSLEMKANAKKITLKMRENYKPIKVSGDKNGIRQVITNLVTNSIKYGKEGGETEIRFFDMEDHVLVEISDNGIGIAKEHLPRLFERFYRVDKGRSREQGGTGLGLAIVKHILEAHGQSVNVRSSEGVGSTFSFTLPKAK